MYLKPFDSTFIYFIIFVIDVYEIYDDIFDIIVVILVIFQWYSAKVRAAAFFADGSPENTKARIPFLCSFL